MGTIEEASADQTSAAASASGRSGPNFKEEKKKLEREIRSLEKSIQAQEAEMEKAKGEVERLTREIQEAA